MTTAPAGSGMAGVAAPSTTKTHSFFRFTSSRTETVPLFAILGSPSWVACSSVTMAPSKAS